ncbi:MAG: tetratricopeptide repeat protein [Anaerolineales bacterium]
MRKKRRRPSHPLRILALLLLIAAAVYLERVVVPSSGPLFVPTATPTRSPAAILLEADSLYQAGNLDQSEAAYREAIQVDPGKAGYYVELARLQAWDGRLTEAETSARNALLIDPSSALASATLAWILDLRANGATTATEQLNLLDQAREQMGKALTQNTNLARVHAYNAEILIDEYLLANENTYESARSEAQKAVQIEPGSLDAHRAMAIVWESTGNYESALESYQAALRINGNLSLLHVKVGDMYLALGDTDSAIERYVRASSLAPTDVVPLRRIVRAYARVGQYARASQYAADAVRLDPSDPYLHGQLGQMYRKNNDLSRAVDELTWAIRGGTIPAAWTVNGLSIEVDDRTRVAANVGVGDTVQVATETTAGGGLLAAEISAVDTSTAEAPVSANDVVVGIVENIRPSVTIEGIRLDGGDQAVEMYYTYALALAESDQCDLAAQVAQAILLGVQDNDTARFNAEEALRICGDLETTPTPEASGTPEG